jgi:thymidylate synthase (FAD)
MRYSGSRIEDFVNANKEACPQDLADDHEFFRGLERLFYLRQPGLYDARSGGRYEYTAESRRRDLIHVYDCAIAYVRARNTGQSEEQARGLLGFDYRQHFVLSLNMRSLMHLLDCRYKPDAQLEVRQLCSLILPHFREWAPQVFEWYEKERLGKGRLGP